MIADQLVLSAKSYMSGLYGKALADGSIKSLE